MSWLFGGEQVNVRVVRRTAVLEIDAVTERSHCCHESRAREDGIRSARMIVRAQVQVQSFADLTTVTIL